MAWASHVAIGAVVLSSAYLAVTAPGRWWLLPIAIAKRRLHVVAA